MIANVEIEQKGDTTWHLRVGGEDISEAVSGVHVHVEGAGRPARVELEFLDLTRFKGDANVAIDPFTAATLKALGWTPPKEEPEPEPTYALTEKGLRMVEERRRLTWFLHDLDWDLGQRADVQEYLTERLEALGGPVSLKEEDD